MVVNGDTLNENDETFFVNLTNATPGSPVVKSTGTGTILDDDFPALSIGNASVSEGDSTNVSAVFTVSLTSSCRAPVCPATVSYGTADGTALAGSDYVTTGGTLTFTTGVTSLPLTGVHAF